MSSTKFVRPHRPSVVELAQGVLAGNRALLGRAITLVESNAAKDQEASRALISKLLPHSGNAVRIGITGGRMDIWTKAVVNVKAANKMCIRDRIHTF